MSRRQSRDSWEARAAHAQEVSRPVPFEALKKAKRKPANTSDVRWRIELRRRARAEYYALFGK